MYKSGFQVFQYGNFFLVLLTWVWLTKVFADYVRVQRGRGLKNRVQASALDRWCGFKVKPQLWCLILSWPVPT